MAALFVALDFIKGAYGQLPPNRSGATSIWVWFANHVVRRVALGGDRAYAGDSEGVREDYGIDGA